MQLYLPSRRIKVVLITLLIILGAGSYLYNRFLISLIQQQESLSVELWAKAVEFSSQPIHDQVSSDLTESARLLSEIPEVPQMIIRRIQSAESAKSSFDFVRSELIAEQRFRIPQIVVNEEGEVITYNHIDADRISPGLIEQFASIRDPISITIGQGATEQTQYVYFGESETVQYLRYFPYFQFALLVLLLGVGYTTYRSIIRSEQSNLWVGMAKEAAHQLGTPISSLYGWLELLRERSSDEGATKELVGEIENDIARLKGVAERFNKIGSTPELNPLPIAPIIDQVMEYMYRRLPKLERQVEVECEISENANVEINAELFQWAVENVIKNAMDAIRDSPSPPKVSVRVHRSEGDLHIDISDSGSGIDHKHLNDIFKPGFSTKMRGWGLGLSLARRIVEEYHDGSISVLRSGPAVGTTIRITLRCVA
ncbi:MAG: HAMP domain-containing sensor histidine kinase [Balneolaceae bacterium]